MASDIRVSPPPKPLEEEMRGNSGVGMALQIEQYLLEKFEAGLESKDKSGSKIALYSHFRKLKKPLEDELHSSLREGKSIRDILYYLNNVLTECQTLSKKQILSKYRIKRSLDNIMGELGRNSGTGGSSNTAQDSNGRSSMKIQEVSRPIPLQKVHGFDREIMLLESLFAESRSDEFKAIGIVGNGGIGKTTLCQLFFSNQEKTKKFLPRIWVSLSRQPDEDSDKRTEIVKRVLFQLGVDVEDEIGDLGTESMSAKDKLSALVALLYKHLWGKKYLIVLDGIRGVNDEWYSNLGSSLSNGAEWGDCLAYGLPKEYGGRVIVTCRNEEMAREMVGEDNLHRIMPLSDPKDCWEIFKKSVGKQIDSTIEEELKKDIENKCAGLPLAAKLMGQLYEQTTSAAPAYPAPQQQ